MNGGQTDRRTVASKLTLECPVCFFFFFCLNTTHVELCGPFLTVWFCLKMYTKLYTSLSGCCRLNIFGSLGKSCVHWIDMLNINI